jgi:DNA-binding MarR family transcriptional regulator
MVDSLIEFWNPARLERRLLEAVEDSSDITQAALAAQPGVATGSLNWVLKQIVRKGDIRVTRLPQRRSRCIVTPQG